MTSRCMRIGLVGVVGLSAIGAIGSTEAIVDDAMTLSKAEIAAGWRWLFDGTTTKGWRGYRQEGFPARGWEIDDQCLHVVAGGGGGDLITTDTFENFEFDFQWRVAERANSGVMYRVTEDHDAPWQTGPEYQVLDDHGHGLKPAISHSAGGLYGLYAPVATKRVRPTGEFNHGRIRIDDDRVSHSLNGETILEAKLGSEDWNARVAASKFHVYEGFGKHARGHLCLQDHGDDVWYRRLKVRDLDAPMPNEIRLFNGKDLTGWTAFSPEGDEAASTTWRADHGALVCAGKPAGYLKTVGTYENFVLKLEWRWNPETKQARNSGVLVRMTGKDRVWPRSVEAQLQSGHAGDFWNIGEVPMTTDPARLNGRRTAKLRPAERPIGEWNEYEIIVDGGRITLHVNGKLVNEAWDAERIAGHVCLQSEGAEIQFRNVRLAPIE